MKRFSLVLMILCAAWLIGCNKDDNEGNGPDKNEPISLMNGSIIINNHPNVKITSLNSFPEGIATENDFSANRMRMGIKSTAEDESGNVLKANDYRFKLVAEMSTLTVGEKGAGVEVQATHVKITDDGFAFVSYNEKGDPHRGGVIVYKFTVRDGSLEEVQVNVEVVSSMQMPKAEVSAIDFYKGKLYITGASSDSNFGYNANEDGYNYAFFMAMELNDNKSFKDVDLKSIKKLTSFQGTSIRVANDRIYVTVGDGTNGTDGGLYIYNATDYTLVKSILRKKYARSVDVDASNIFLMQAQPARITKYDLEGNNETLIYETTDESMQQDAKSEMLVWDQYLFAAENESGMRMIFKETGDLNASLERPGEDPENEVTNSVSMNSDLKKNFGGKDVQSNLLFLANGQKGLYWYDVMKDADGTDWIVPGKDNSFMLGEKEKGSANFVASKGNIVFVADGLGGLKVLYIGFNNGDTPPPPLPKACDQFMTYLYKADDALLPEGKSVFKSTNGIVKDLFTDKASVPNYIEVKNSTELYISFLGQWASFSNAMGYFVIPDGVEKTDEAEYEYYLQNIKPNMVGKNNVLKDEYKLFNNIKALKVGDTYQIGNKKFNAGDRVVLFIAPDSWHSQNNQVVVSFSKGSYNQIFFTHTWINLSSGIDYYRSFGNFKGVQYNTYYSIDCKSMVMFFEDKHSQSDVDTDYNDCFFSITDNTNQGELTNIVLPKYAISVENGKPELSETANYFK